MISKELHRLLSGTDHPAILISGKKIRNKDIDRLVESARNEQFQPGDFPLGRFRVVVDDFDECTLPDGVKESIVEALCENYASCIIVSFSNAPAFYSHPRICRRLSFSSSIQ